METAPAVPEPYARRVERDAATGCIIWAGSRDRDGYGLAKERGRRVRVHRRVWELANGRSIPDGHVVRHWCDCPACIRPDHLVLGTPADNVEDRQARARQARGSRNGRAKLTEGQVSAAKRVLADRAVPTNRLARLLDVDRTTVRDIEQGRIWSHVAPEGRCSQTPSTVASDEFVCERAEVSLA